MNHLILQDVLNIDQKKGMIMEEKTPDTGEKLTGDCGCEEGKVPNMEGKCVMPEVTFSAFVMSLNTSALYHLGEIKDPTTGQSEVNHELARHAIDTLVMLQGKTKGNLSDDEEAMLKNIVYDIKMRFVQAVK